MLFDWPVDRARVSRGFLPNRKRPHLGLDLTGPRGTPILSAQQGSVVYAGRDFRGFGNMVLIESGQGWATIYGHLEKILVTEGQRVSQGIKPQSGPDHRIAQAAGNGQRSALLTVTAMG